MKNTFSKLIISMNLFFTPAAFAGMACPNGSTNIADTLNVCNQINFTCTALEGGPFQRPYIYNTDFERSTMATDGGAPVAIEWTHTDGQITFLWPLSGSISRCAVQMSLIADETLLEERSTFQATQRTDLVGGPDCGGEGVDVLMTCSRF